MNCPQSRNERKEHKDTYMTNYNIKTNLKMEKVPITENTKTRYIVNLGTCRS